MRGFFPFHHGFHHGFPGGGFPGGSFMGNRGGGNGMASMGALMAGMMLGAMMRGARPPTMGPQGYDNPYLSDEAQQCGANQQQEMMQMMQLLLMLLTMILSGGMNPLQNPNLNGAPGGLPDQDSGAVPGTADMGAPGNPGNLGGVPGNLGGAPGDLGGAPGNLGGAPGDLGGAPGDLGGAPAGRRHRRGGRPDSMGAPDSIPDGPGTDRPAQGPGGIPQVTPSGPPGNAIQYLLALNNKYGKHPEDTRSITNLQAPFAQRAEGFFQQLTAHGVEPRITAGWATSGHNPGSAHYQGRAMDFTGGFGQEGMVRQLAQQAGLKVIREYPGSTPATTGSHYHIEYDG